MAKGVSIGVSYALCGWLVQKYNGLSKVVENCTSTHIVPALVFSAKW